MVGPIATSAPTLTATQVKQLAAAAGFDLARITDASDLHVARARYLQWVKDGRQGEMRWITAERAERSASPRTVLPDARSVICVAIPYWAGQRPPTEGRTRGTIARYAWGLDYHRIMEERLHRLAADLEQAFGGRHRWYVDTGPLMDKALAERSGIGWYGKNTNILTERFGSFVLLGEIITTLQLEPDEAIKRDCGSCRLCVAACPTGALGPEYTIDSPRCISYLTIEHRGPIPRELRPLMGGWVFGCDICQDVCPPTMASYLDGPRGRRAWAASVRATLARRENPAQEATAAGDELVLGGAHPLFARGVRRTDVDLLWLLRLTHEEYVEAFRGTSIKRAKCWMLRRNAAVALGNVGGFDAVSPLGDVLRGDEEPVVRGHAAWALSRISTRLGTDVRATLRAASDAETDEAVQEEILTALETVAAIDS